MRATMYASFTTGESAERAIGALLDHGVSANDVSVVFHENFRGFGTPPNFDNIQKIRDTAETGITTTTGPDAAAGAAKGAGIGLGIGALAALAMVFIPGIGIVLGGGALATALGGVAGATAAGAVAGGAAGFLKDQGIPEPQIKKYEETFSQGGAIVSVLVPSNDISGATVESVLSKYGAIEGGFYTAPDRQRTAADSEPAGLIY